MIPGTAEVPGPAVRTGPPGNTPVIQTGTLDTARGQGFTPEGPGEGAARSPGGIRLVFNAYLASAMLIVVVRMLVFPPRRTRDED